MTKQAPLPWTLTQNSWQYTTIYDAERNHVCRLDLEDWSVTEDNQDELEKVQTQIAERIVRAVNNHDALVEALKFATEILESYSFSRGIDPRTATPESAIGRCRGVLASLGAPGGDK